MVRIAERFYLLFKAGVEAQTGDEATVVFKRKTLRFGEFPS